MKRRRKSTVSNTQMRKKDCEQNQISGLSINNLYLDIVVKIMLKLSVKSIIMCKSVCKTWRSLISDPNFVKLHLALSKTCTLIRNSHNLRFSRSLYLLEPEDVCNPDSGYCLCIAESADKWCKHFHFNKRVESKLKMPLMNAQVMLDIVKSRSNSVWFGAASRSKNKGFIKLKAGDHRYDVASSCNGLLLLSRYTDGVIGIKTDTNPFVVCNPVTGEFVHLIEDYNNGLANNGMDWFPIGLGFSPKHNQYKAIRMKGQWRNSTFPLHSRGVQVAQIHTLGTDSWRNMNIPGIEIEHVSPPAYLDGALHWVFVDRQKNCKVASFDMDEERYQILSVPSPPPPPQPLLYWNPLYLAITVIGGRVYVYTDLIYSHVVIWVMDGNGISKSLTKLFSVDVSEFRRSLTYHFRHQLISCSNNDAIVMFNGGLKEFIYYDQFNVPRFSRLKFQGLVSDCEAIPYAPSFVSLEEVMMQSNVEVQNINSGCGNLRLLEEKYPLLLRSGKNKNKLDMSSGS